MGQYYMSIKISPKTNSNTSCTVVNNQMFSMHEWIPIDCNDVVENVMVVCEYPLAQDKDQSKDSIQKLSNWQMCVSNYVSIEVKQTHRNFIYD